MRSILVILTLIASVLFPCNAAAQEGYEPVLVPFDSGVLPGRANWRAELRVRNSTDSPINLFPEVCSFWGVPYPCDTKIVVQPGTTLLDVLKYASTDLPGVMLYVPSAHTDDVHFTLHVGEAGASTRAGAVIPVVRTSDLRTAFTIVGVPMSAALRRTVRVYQQGYPEQSVFRVRVIDEVSNRVIVEREYSRGSASDIPGLFVPATFDFSDCLADDRAQSSERVTVVIERIWPSNMKFWPIISVTSNTDNSVAIYTAH